MAEQSKTVQGVKTMLKGKEDSKASSVKDQVKAALLKNKSKAQANTVPTSGSSPQNLNSVAAAVQNSMNSVQGSVNAVNAMNNASTGPMLTKIEKTVDSINEVHSTMESLNKNMNMFVDLFNRRGGSLASGGDSQSLPMSNTSTAGTSSSTPSSTKSSLGGMAGNMGPGDNGQNAVTTLLLTNLLKKTDSESEEKLSNYEKGSPEYLELLIKKLDKFQHEYELLQYLFEPKMFGNTLEPTNDAQGNSAWLAGFMSMMVNNRK